MKTYRVYLKNGTQLKIKADSYKFTEDRSAVVFYHAQDEMITDVYVYAGEVAAILPQQDKGKLDNRST
jgi:hypothetical protein